MRYPQDAPCLRCDGELYRKCFEATRCLMGEGMISNAQLDNWFTYLADRPSEREGYEKICAAALVFATIVRDLTPPSADQTAAIRKIREAVFTANASLACGGA